MANLQNWHDFEKKLKEKNILLFSRLDVSRAFGATPVAAKFLLHRYAKKGFITRVKRGLYSFSGGSAIPAPYMANKLYEPSYVSLEFALSYHRIIPEAVYEITSVTTKKTKRFQTGGKTFSYRRIKKNAFTGYASVRQGAFTFFVADPEKAFVDLAYLRVIRQKVFLDRFNKKRINRNKALRYSRLFENEILVKFIKNILK